MRNYLQQFSGLKPVKAYDAKTSLSLAVLCYLAYKKEEYIIAKSTEKWFRKCKFLTVSKGKDIDTQCFVAADDENIIVVFRGSSSIQDWFANFQAVSDPGPLENTKAHEGFQDALYPSVIRITNIIDEFRDNNQRIWVTGHSLGGALCTLYSAMMFEAGYTIYGIYTFASPRPGDRHLAIELNNRMEGEGKGPHFRVMNDGDVVPHLPPEPFFSHSGNRIMLFRDKIQKNRTCWQNQKRSVFDRFMQMVGQALNKVDIKDNHVLTGEEGYIARLASQVNRGE